MLKFKFFITIPNKKKDEIIFEHGKTFKECLIRAEKREKQMKGKITGWDEIKED